MEDVTPTPPTKPAKTPSRTQPQIKADRVFIAELYVRGVTQHSIAAELSKRHPFPLSRSLVAKEIGIIQDEWCKRADEAISRVKARQLATIDAVERTAWERFDASCKPGERTQKERESGESAPDEQGKKTATGSKSKARVVTENRDGDPRWLDLVLKCVERRCRILGLDAPTRGVIDVDAEVKTTSATPEPTRGFDTTTAWALVVEEAKRELATVEPPSSTLSA